MSVLELPKHLSASSISTYQQCPLRFRFSRIDKIPEPPTQPQVLGTFVHEILEKLYELPAEERTIPNARSIAATAWADTYATKADGVGVFGDKINDFRWRAWWCVENLFDMEDPTTLNLRGVETKFSDKINGVPLLGYIDRWSEEDAGITVTDYKTGKVTKPQYDADKVFQLVLYALMLESSEDVSVHSSEILYVRFKERVRYEPTPKRRSTVLSIVESTWEGVQTGCESGVFAPTVNNLCNWCAYKSICPAWS
jgi:putative RecB family exonuclease